MFQKNHFDAVQNGITAGNKIAEPWSTAVPDQSPQRKLCERIRATFAPHLVRTPLGAFRILDVIFWTIELWT